MGATGKQYQLNPVTVQCSGRIPLSNKYRVTAVIGHKEVLAAHTALQDTLNELALLHELELSVLLLEEAVLHQVKNYVQTHAAHGMSLQLELIIQAFYTYTAVLIVTEPVRNKVRHSPSVKADTSFK